MIRLTSHPGTHLPRLTSRPIAPLRILCGELLLLLTLAPSAQTQTPAQPDPLAQARTLIRQNNLPPAEPILRTFLATAPNSAPARYLLAFLLHLENKPRDSLAAYTEAAALKPPQSEDLRIVALDYVLLDDYPDAIHWLNRSLAADPRNAEAWYDLGRAQMNQGNFVEAERDFNHTLALVPNLPKALDNLGLSLEAQNRTYEALTAYTRAIAAQSSRPGSIQTASTHPSEQPLLNLGTLLNARTRSAEAVPLLVEAILIAPKCPRCHEELSRAYTATGQDAPATREMAEAVSLDPKNPRLHYQLGQIYRRSGLSAMADAELKISANLYGSHSSEANR